MEESGYSRFTLAKTILYFLVIIIFINSMFLDWKFFFQPLLSTSSTNDTSQPTSERISKTPVNCTPNCPSTTPAISDVIPNSVSTSPTGNVTSITNALGAKEYFVPFGTGTQTATDWKDIPGMEATIDTNNFPNLKSVLLEVTVHVPTANETVYVQLYDVTDKHPVWYSDLYYNGGSDPQLLVTNPLTLEKGSKLYRVQMKTQLEYPAIIDQARLHIITN